MLSIPARVGWRACAGPLAALAAGTCVAACGTWKTSTASTRASSARVDAGAAAEAASDAYSVIAHVEPRQSANFALLRTQPEGLPARVRAALRTPGFGVNWRLAQRIPVTLPGAYWLVPGNGYLCVVAMESLGTPGVSTTCAPTAHAVGHGIASIAISPPKPASSGPGSRLIVGVAPDRTREIRVHTHGSVETTPVLEGIFVVRDSLAAPPDLLTLRRPSGAGARR